MLTNLHTKNEVNRQNGSKCMFETIMLFDVCDLDLDLLALVFKFDQDTMVTCLHIINKVIKSNGLKAMA